MNKYLIKSRATAYYVACVYGETEEAAISNFWDGDYTDPNAETPFDICDEEIDDVMEVTEDA